MERTIVSTNTAISIGLVITLLAAAVSFGIIYAQVQQLRADVSDVKDRIVKVDDKLNDLRSNKVTKQ